VIYLGKVKEKTVQKKAPNGILYSSRSGTVPILSHYVTFVKKYVKRYAYNVFKFIVTVVLCDILNTLIQVLMQSLISIG